MQKLTVGILAGGRSAEHEVSLRSAQTILDNIDRSKYQPVLITIDRQGKWLDDDGKQLLLDASAGHGAVIDKKTGQVVYQLDVLFPILHGPYGEDGSVQGLAKLADLPCVGADILGSAVAMDKEVMKRLLREQQVPVGLFAIVNHENELNYPQLAKKLGPVLFIKPANMGSSVGVTKITNERQFKQAVKQAFRYDDKVIVEQTIEGRELEVSVLGNDQLQVSVVGEIITDDKFYSYDAKYDDESEAKLIIPAKLTADQERQLKKIAKEAYRALCCQGMARVDLFLTKNNQILVNEINTLPGFTSISMYPKLWAESGKPIPALISELIDLATQSFQRRTNLDINPY